MHPSLLPVGDFVKDWEVSRQFTIAVASKMPAEAYDFKPCKGQMSFGEQMVHIAAALFYRFREISGKDAPYSELPKKITREIAMEWLSKSFDYVIAILPTLTDAQLAKARLKVDWPGRPEASGRDMIMNMFVHTAHHRAQCEVYLRLKGIAPPEYTF